MSEPKYNFQLETLLMVQNALNAFDYVPDFPIQPHPGLSLNVTAEFIEGKIYVSQTWVRHNTPETIYTTIKEINDANRN